MSDLKVFKFGGASLKNPDNIKNVAAILQKYASEKLVIIVSAMGKTTNALEDVVKFYFEDRPKAFEIIHKLHNDHKTIMDALFDRNDDIYASVNDTFVEVEWILEDEPHDKYDYVYDQIVSVGELVSSKIVAAYLNKIGLKTQWLDARDVLKTDETWRESVINWTETISNAQKNVKPMLSDSPLGAGGNFIITQGFIGSTKDNNTTTLGREGSDYSAAIFSHCLDASGMYIWKDVSGVLSGDPRIFKKVVKLDKISYAEAIEMTYYGATVVHPRTIQPLMTKNIPLHVRSFIDHEAPGTVISVDTEGVKFPPLYMAELNQIFLKVSNKDFTFLVESHIRDLFDIFAKYHIFVNLLQNSGGYFFVSITHAPDRERELMREIRERFNVEEMHNLDLFTIRHPTPSVIKAFKKNKIVVFERTIPDTYQVILKK
jgi:aspartate kinase